jgi:hypothetical protein
VGRTKTFFPPSEELNGTYNPKKGDSFMKTYIYSIKSDKSRREGGRYIIVEVYRMKRNLPIFLGEVGWCTTSYHGNDTEIAEFLVWEKEIPAKWLSDSGHKITNGKYRIIGV